MISAPNKHFIPKAILSLWQKNTWAVIQLPLNSVLCVKEENTVYTCTAFTCILLWQHVFLYGHIKEICKYEKEKM